MKHTQIKVVIPALYLFVLSVPVFAQSNSGTPQVPVNVTPAVSESLIQGSTVTFTWQAQSGVDAYDFHLFDRTDGDLTFTNNLNPASICNGSLCSVQQTISLPAIPDHAWRVRAESGSNISAWSRNLFNVVPSGSSVTPSSTVTTTTTTTAMPVVPVNVSPGVGESLEAGSTVTFTWQAQPGVDAYDFHLFDKTDGALTFIRDIFPSQVCSGTLCSIQQTIALPAIENHAWRVRAKTVSSISSWSRSIFDVVQSSGTNSTQTTTPVIPTSTPTSGGVSVPVNISPAVGESLAFGDSVTFTWQAQTGVSSYDFHLFDRTNGNLTFKNNLNPSSICTAGQCSIQHSIDLPVFENHAWRVRARSASTTTGWSRSVFDVVGASGGTTTTVTPVVPVTPVVTVTPEASGEFQPGSTFYWQLQGSINTSRDVDVFGIDLEDNEFNGVIDTLKARGKLVVCYISAGSYEEWRSDAGAFRSDDLGNPLDNWPGERFADIRSSNVRQIMRSRMDRAANANCDAIEPDNTDAYQANNGLGLSVQDQINYLQFLANYAHSVGLKIGLKNTVDLITAANFASTFDFTINESCYNFNECNTLSAFTRNNKAVYIAQYGSQNQSWCNNATANDFFLAFYNPNQLLNGSFYAACN